MAKKTHTTTPPRPVRIVVPDKEVTMVQLLLRLLAVEQADDLALLKQDVATFLKEQGK